MPHNCKIYGILFHVAKRDSLCLSIPQGKFIPLYFAIVLQNLLCSLPNLPKRNNKKTPSAFLRKQEEGAFFYWLPGRDSNPRQGGYKFSSCFHEAWTISSPYPAFMRDLGIGRLQEHIDWVSHSLVSARFRLLLNPSADFAQDYHAATRSFQ